jgi:hypothetical protein
MADFLRIPVRAAISDFAFVGAARGQTKRRNDEPLTDSLTIGFVVVVEINRSSISLQLRVPMARTIFSPTISLPTASLYCLYDGFGDDVF